MNTQGFHLKGHLPAEHEDHEQTGFSLKGMQGSHLKGHLPAERDDHEHVGFSLKGTLTC